MKQERNIAADIERIRKRFASMGATLSRFTDHTKRVAAQFAVYQKRIGDITAGLDRFTEQIYPAMSRFRESLQKAPKSIRETPLLMAEECWFLSMDVPLVAAGKIRAKLREGDFTTVNRWLCDYYGGRLDELETELTTSHPNRARIISKALAAHRNGDYELSIPILLIQADGICFDVTKLGMFQKRDKKPQTAAFVEETATDSIMEAFLEPLRVTTPISASARERGPGFNALNRHQILHGECSDYGNETNAFKCISLIAYINSTLAWFRDDLEEDAG